MMQLSKPPGHTPITDHSAEGRDSKWRSKETPDCRGNVPHGKNMLHGLKLRLATTELYLGNIRHKEQDL